MTASWAALFERAATYEVDEDRIRSVTFTTMESAEETDG